MSDLTRVMETARHCSVCWPLPINKHCRGATTMTTLLLEESLLSHCKLSN